ncbi:MAG: relaxase domain-containing protein, partial [Ilumatobacter sp.]|nr:relaxase domain-containing protein [Ilumatobacter sp.]
MTTIYAASAGASARYYTGYLTEPDGELPGHWTGRQAAAFGLAGEVSTEALESLLSGRNPMTGQVLGRELLDRVDRHGNVTKAVAGYDATFSAPKSLSVLWALTGDDGLADCHDRAVDAAVAMIEKYGSTTRIRSNGTRLHPDTGGLTAAVFRQSTSRADDPQLHTHVVISAKVQTDDGRWWALDARLLKRHQQTFGYVYQSALRAELTARYGVAFDEIVNGQAEIAGVPVELLHQFSKRAHVIAVEMDQRIADFIVRTGREPTDGEYAAMERETAADTRDHKTGLGVPDLRSRWDREAEGAGYDAIDLVDSVRRAAREHVVEAQTVTVAEVLEELAERRSTWNRMDVLRTLAGAARPQPGHDATSWARALEAGADRVLDACIDLDPIIGGARRRGSDGRSLLIEPVANRATSEQVLAQEERIITFAIDAQLDVPAPAITIADTDLDDGQAAAAAAVAGDDRLVLVVGPAGAGKTRMLAAAVDDLHARRRPVIGVAPTGKAAAVLGREAGVAADTIAKFLRDLDQPSSGATWSDPGPGTTIIVDEAGMVRTADLDRLIDHAQRSQWRLVLVGDPYQLQAVGRGGMFAELCETGRTVELDQLHRFEHPWEATASLHLRAGDSRALATYAEFGRIRPGTFDEHLDAIADEWQTANTAGETLSITSTRNEHVTAINHHIQNSRLLSADLDTGTATQIVGGTVMVGDVVATRHNDRRLRTTTGDSIRNRHRWTITHTSHDGVTVTRLGGHGTITLPTDYVRQHVELAYATTEHGAQGDTADRSITLATNATSGRNLYVGMTRGRTDNTTLVVTETHDLNEAINILEAAITLDRSDLPAVAQRRALAELAAPRPRPEPSNRDLLDQLRTAGARQ